jgi:GxxExxY protein
MERKTDLIYPELSYKLVGLLFEIHNTLGPGHKEKVYEDALASLFDDEDIKYERQLQHPIKLRDKIIGKYILDFLVEDKVIIELKQGNRFTKKNIDQVLNYLRAKNLKLAIICQFGTDAVKFKRIVNIKD